MLRFNQSYGYSKKYQELADSSDQQRPKVNDKTKKLCIDNKKRRRQFEERQRVHEKNEQKRREEALSSRRRRQQEATNAYKAALSKELTKRNKTPLSRISSASSIGSQGSTRGRQYYRSPTVDEVLSNIRGHALGGSLRTYGESSSAPTPPTARTYTPVSSYTSPTYVKNVVSFSSPPKHQDTRTETRQEHRHDTRSDTRTEMRSGSEGRSELPQETVDPQDRDYFSNMKPERRVTLASDIRGTLSGDAGRGKEQTGRSSLEVRSYLTGDVVRQNNGSTGEVPLRDSLDGEVTSPTLLSSHHSSSSTLLPSHHSSNSTNGRGDYEERGDPDRIRVQIDLTKFDQLDVSDCESLDEPPIDPTSEDYPVRHPSSSSSFHSSRQNGDKHTESYTDLSQLSGESKGIQLLQADDVATRAPSYFGPPDNTHTANSDPNLAKLRKQPGEEVPKSYSSQSMSEQPNYSIHTDAGESLIFANNPVEAVKAASAAVSTPNGSESGSSRNAWSSRPPSGLSEGRSKSLKSLIKRTPSARGKQVRWDSVSALDDETMEVDQFDISSEGEAVFKRQYSHPGSPLRSVRATADERPTTNSLQRTPTDAEINALWTKVRTTLHHNQAWDSPQSKSALPQRAPPVAPRAPAVAPNRRDASQRMQESLRIYTNVMVDNDRYKVTKRGPMKSASPSQNGPSLAKMTELTENGHTMLSMEEQRILQSLERLDAKLKDTAEPAETKTQIVTFSSPTLDVSRQPVRNETYKRLLNRKTNGVSSKYR